MAQQNISIGSAPNDKTGDPLRTAFSKVNANFTELYATTSADVQIPAQTNNNGKYLTTNGTSLSWGTISTTTNQLVNGAHTVTVGSDGYLTVESLYVQGYLKGVDGSTGSTGQVLTRQSNGGVAWANATGGTVDRLVNGDFNFILGPDGTVNFDPSSANGKGILQTAADLQFIAVDKTWTFGADGSLQFPDATVQTTAALPYVKTAYNVVNATATMDTITVSWFLSGSGNHVQYSTLSSSDVTYAYSGMNIIAGVTTSFNSAGTYVMNAANYPDPPWFYGIFNTIGDVQIVYMQDITNSKTYRITATATSTYTGAAARGSILIERII